MLKELRRLPNKESLFNIWNQKKEDPKQKKGVSEKGVSSSAQESHKCVVSVGIVWMDGFGH